MTTSTLTLESAKAYVSAYHAGLGELVDIEGCGFIAEGDCAVVRLNVIVRNQAGASSICLWDVWSEPLLSGALYGEF